MLGGVRYRQAVQRPAEQPWQLNSDVLPPLSSQAAVCCLQIALWTAGFVVMTLVINAPLLPWVMRKTGLAAIASVKRRMRAKAVRALVRFTNAAIEDLKDDQDEMLRGAIAIDWELHAHDNWIACMSSGCCSAHRFPAAF